MKFKPGDKIHHANSTSHTYTVVASGHTTAGIEFVLFERPGGTLNTARAEALQPAPVYFEVGQTYISRALRSARPFRVIALEDTWAIAIWDRPRTYGQPPAVDAINQARAGHYRLVEDEEGA